MGSHCAAQATLLPVLTLQMRVATPGNFLNSYYSGLYAAGPCVQNIVFPQPHPFLANSSQPSRSSLLLDSTLLEGGQVKTGSQYKPGLASNSVIQAGLESQPPKLQV